MIPGQQTQQRKTHLIKKEFQYKFILKFCLIILAGVIVSTSLLFAFSQDTLTSSFNQSRLVIRSTGYAILPAVVYTNLITLGLVTLAAFIVILYLSHKIAGPIFRFEKELKNIGEGDLTVKIVLREDDQVKDMADSINQMVGRLHQKVHMLNTDVANMLNSIADQNVPEAVTEGIKDFQQQIEKNFTL